MSQPICSHGFISSQQMTSSISRDQLVKTLLTRTPVDPLTRNHDFARSLIGVRRLCFENRVLPGESQQRFHPLLSALSLSLSLSLSKRRLSLLRRLQLSEAFIRLVLLWALDTFIPVLVTPQLKLFRFYAGRKKKKRVKLSHCLMCKINM